MSIKQLKGRLLTLVGTMTLTMVGLSPALAAVEPERGVGYYPRDISVDGWRIDWLIDITMVFTLILSIMCAWMAYSWFFHDEKHQADYDHGQSKHHVITAVILSSVIFWVVDGNLLVNSIIDTRDAFWNFQIPEENPETVRVQVNARQWAWQGRYAGPDDKFGTEDDIVVLKTSRSLLIPLSPAARRGRRDSRLLSPEPEKQDGRGAGDGEQDVVRGHRGPRCGHRVHPAHGTNH